MKFNKENWVASAPPDFFEAVEFLEDGSPIIATLEGNHKVTEGDFIIRGIKGEFYPCKPDIFEATYEKVND